MRYVEIAGGINIMISNEEQELLDMYRELGRIKKAELTERGQELARILVSKGVLNRVTNSNNETYYIPNKQEKLWRL
jgi:hypothetical protein